MLFLPVTPVVLALLVEFDITGGAYILTKFLNPGESPVGGIETVFPALDKPPASFLEGWLLGNLYGRSESFSERAHQDSGFDFSLAPQGIGDDAEGTVRNSDERNFGNVLLDFFCKIVERLVEGLDGRGFHPVVLLAGRCTDDGVGREHLG